MLWTHGNHTHRPTASCATVAVTSSRPPSRHLPFPPALPPHQIKAKPPSWITSATDTYLGLARLLGHGPGSSQRLTYLHWSTFPPYRIPSNPMPHAVGYHFTLQRALPAAVL
ncbi:hypothetical protein CCHR01_03053 [Colletotrichum chrysophilum]|uniref:Uncharacterized protein n=1 Tax=Colletotrichum chrysophilum TaxID=1836956 RepID=A0AAD9AUL3_9PEZI|nr:hypothetical protein CCHR01_03053 [Colletotrichum chrysophilum]